MPKICEFANCRTRACYGLYYETPIMCTAHKGEYKPQYNICVCGKHEPHFNYVGQKKKYCSSCKLDGMINVKIKNCFCGKVQACYNYEGLKPEYCGKCKLENMINLVETKCFCGKTGARFNYEGLRPEYCSECKLENMINVRIKKCLCGKSQSCYNYEGLKPKYCGKCKLEGMINLVKKKCYCGKSQSSYNYEGLKPEYCSSCKLEGMIDVVHKKCNCSKCTPTFNYNGLTAQYCSSCKLEGMVNVVNKKCFCNKCIPTFNYYGLTPQYCSSCKLDGMVNVNNKKCKGDFCIETSANPKYKGYCKHCYQLTFPNDPLTFQMKSKTKEIAVRDFINSIFDGFSHDQPLWTGNCDCTHRRRIDHRKLIGNTLLCIETDEYQHKGYNKTDEQIRYDDLFMIHGGKFVFIRFNPDKYTVNGKQRNPYLFVRLSVLEQEIKKQIKRIENDENTELLEIIKLYYDEFECKNTENTIKLENTFVENNSILNK